MEYHLEDIENVTSDYVGYDYYDYAFNDTEWMSLFNNSHTYPRSKDLHARVADAVAVTFALAAVLVNTPTIVVLCTTCGQLSCQLRFVLNQCVLDLSLAVYYALNPFLSKMPLWISVLLDECYLLLNWLVCVNLTLLTLDQFLAITMGIQYKAVVTRGKVNWALFGSHAVGALYLAVFFGSLAVVWHIDEDTSHDFWVWYMMSHLQNHLYTAQYYVCVALLAICTLTLVVVYSYVLYVVFRPGHETRARVTAKSQRKAAGVSFLVVFTFIVCTVFHFAYYIVPLNRGGEMSSDRLAVNTYPLLALNCLFDPLLYAIRLDKIKKGYRRAWDATVCNQRRRASMARDMTLSTIPAPRDTGVIENPQP